jgi:hypothetical protein
MKQLIPDNSRLLKIVPELTFFSDAADRHQAWQRAFKTFRWRYFGLMWLFGTGLAAVNVQLFSWLLGWAQLLFWMPRLPSLAEWALRYLFNMALMAVILSWLFMLFRRRIQCALRQQLVDRGVPICFQCGYDLRGQVDPRCPECGSGFDARLIRRTQAMPQEPPPRSGDG